MNAIDGTQGTKHKEMEAKKARKNAAMEKNKIKQEAAEAKMGEKGKE